MRNITCKKIIIAGLLLMILSLCNACNMTGNTVTGDAAKEIPFSYLELIGEAVLNSNQGDVYLVYDYDESNQECIEIINKCADVCDGKYTKEWFGSHQLIVVNKYENSVPASHEVISVVVGNKIEISIERILPGPFSGVYFIGTNCTILIEIERELTKESIIELKYSNSTRPRIVKNNNMDQEQPKIPKLGEVLYSPGLIDSAKDPSNCDSIFFVRVTANCFETEYDSFCLMLKRWKKYDDFIDWEGKSAKLLLTPEQVLSITASENIGLYIEWLYYDADNIDY